MQVLVFAMFAVFAMCWSSRAEGGDTCPEEAGFSTTTDVDIAPTRWQYLPLKGCSGGTCAKIKLSLILLSESDDDDPPLDSISVVATDKTGVGELEDGTDPSSLTTTFSTFEVTDQEECYSIDSVSVPSSAPETIYLMFKCIPNQSGQVAPCLGAIAWEYVTDCSGCKELADACPGVWQGTEVDAMGLDDLSDCATTGDDDGGVGGDDSIGDDDTGSFDTCESDAESEWDTGDFVDITITKGESEYFEVNGCSSSGACHSLTYSVIGATDKPAFSTYIVDEDSRDAAVSDNWEDVNSLGGESIKRCIFDDVGIDFNTDTAEDKMYVLIYCEGVSQDCAVSYAFSNEEISVTPTPSPSPVVEPSADPTPSASQSPLPKEPTPSVTPSANPTPSTSPGDVTPSTTPSFTPASTPTSTPSNSPSVTPSPSSTSSPSPSAGGSPSTSPTPSPGSSPSSSPSNSPTPSASPSTSPSNLATPSTSPTPARTPTPTPSVTPTPSFVPEIPTSTPTPSPLPTPGVWDETQDGDCIAPVQLVSGDIMTWTLKEREWANLTLTHCGSNTCTNVRFSVISTSYSSQFTVFGVDDDNRALLTDGASPDSIESLPSFSSQTPTTCFSRAFLSTPPVSSSSYHVMIRCDRASSTTGRCNLEGALAYNRHPNNLPAKVDVRGGVGIARGGGLGSCAEFPHDVAPRPQHALIPAGDVLVLEMNGCLRGPDGCHDVRFAARSTGTSLNADVASDDAAIDANLPRISIFGVDATGRSKVLNGNSPTYNTNWLWTDRMCMGDGILRVAPRTVGDKWFIAIACNAPRSGKFDPETDTGSGALVYPMCSVEYALSYTRPTPSYSGGGTTNDDDAIAPSPLPAPSKAVGATCSNNYDCLSLRCRGGVCCAPSVASSCAVCARTTGVCTASVGDTISDCPSSCSDPSLEVICGDTSRSSFQCTSSKNDATGAMETSGQCQCNGKVSTWSSADSSCETSNFVACPNAVDVLNNDTAALDVALNGKKNGGDDDVGSNNNGGSGGDDGAASTASLTIVLLIMFGAAGAIGVWYVRKYRPQWALSAGLVSPPDENAVLLKGRSSRVIQSPVRAAMRRMSAASAYGIGGGGAAASTSGAVEDNPMLRREFLRLRGKSDGEAV